MSLDELTSRQRTILGLVVREYVKSTDPVSSRALVEQYGPRAARTSLNQELLAWSHTMARRQKEAQQSPDKDARTLAIDLLLMDSQW